MRRFFLLTVLILGGFAFSEFTRTACAQNPAHAGKHFTLGVIEGSELLAGQQTGSIINLTVLSQSSGTGSIISPCGFTASFSYTPFTPTVLSLPDSLIHLNDLGSTKKGLILSTTSPVSLMLHDFIPAAGDATQIYPDDALDTSYVISAWGIFNDPQDNENNRDEFLVVSASDENLVTITPSIGTLNGKAAGVPFRVSMSKGDCYVVKADASSSLTTTMLSGTTVSSTAPVSVFTGSTCAYNPVGAQSCNELMDELTGKRFWGKDFFVQRLGNGDSSITALLTSNQTFTMTITYYSGNSFSMPSVGGYQYVTIPAPAEITTDVPVQCQQLTQGSSISFNGVSDPTLVTILPVTRYCDTVIWYAPSLNGTFQHWAPIIYPTAQAKNILLDAVPLSNIPSSNLLAPPLQMGTSSYSELTVSVGAGVHILTSPVPVFALATGFASADAYSFIPASVAATSLRSAVEQADRTPELTVTVHPNPSSDMVWVQANEPLAHARLIDALGRTVKSYELDGPDNALQVAGLPSGTYYLIVQAANGTSNAEFQRTQIVILH